MPETPPTGWVKTTLGKIAEPSRERASPKDDPAMRYVGLEHIEPQSMRLLSYGHAREARSSSVRFSRGDILYGKMRPYLNKVWVADFDGLCSAEFLVFPKQDGLSSRFLALRLNAEDFVAFANGQVSGERPRVDFEKLSHFPILLPPIAEQERIVDKLDVALSRMQRAEAAASRSSERLQRYRAAVLRTAITGDLTHSWRESHLRRQKVEAETGALQLQRLLADRRTRWEEAESQRLLASGREPKDNKWKARYREPMPADASALSEEPEGWLRASIDQIASGESGAIQSGPFGSQLLHSEFVGEGILAIGIDNVLDGAFSLGRQNRITPRKYEALKKFTAHPLDVVITVMATVGRVCVLPLNLEPAIITKHCYRITPNKAWVDSHYLSFVLRGDAPTRRHIFGNVRGQTRPGINGMILKTAPVAIPSLDEQLEVVRQVDRRLSAADQLQGKVEEQMTRAHSARQLLLRDAFSGRLLPQDPRDGSASVSLDRIRITRDVAAQKPRAKRMPKSTSKTKRRPLLEVLQEHKKPMTPEQLFEESGFEYEFKKTKSSQEVVDRFYFELRQLTESPAKVRQVKRGDLILMEVIA